MRQVVTVEIICVKDMAFEVREPILSFHLLDVLC